MILGDYPRPSRHCRSDWLGQLERRFTELRRSSHLLKLHNSFRSQISSHLHCKYVPALPDEPGSLFFLLGTVLGLQRLETYCGLQRPTVMDRRVVTLPTLLGLIQKVKAWTPKVLKNHLLAQSFPFPPTIFGRYHTQHSAPLSARESPRVPPSVLLAPAFSTTIREEPS